MPARPAVPARPDERRGEVVPDGNVAQDGNGREPEAGIARLVLTADGPVLVAGPVDLEMPDGTQVCSRRPMTAVCTCRRSRRYPFCDASHRTPPAGTGEGTP